MTREEWKERLPLIQAFVEGKRIESRPVGYASWHNSVVPDFMLPTHLYRIAHEPNLRPWTAEEVPDCWVRTKGSDIKHRIVEVDSDNASFRAGRTFYSTLEFAFGSCEHSTDGGKTWLPCGVVEGEK